MIFGQSVHLPPGPWAETSRGQQGNGFVEDLIIIDTRSSYDKIILPQSASVNLSK